MLVALETFYHQHWFSPVIDCRVLYPTARMLGFASAAPAAGVICAFRRPLLTCRPQRLACKKFSRTLERPCMCAPVRETDPRGFVLPVPGDVVLFPGRWADEDSAGLVEAVRPREGGKESSVVDVVEMKDVGETLFAATRKRRWFDVADVRIAMDAEYIAAQDAYRIASARTGYAELPPMDAAQKAAADAEYIELKRRMLLTTAAAGVTGALVAAVGISIDVAYSFTLGSLASLAYLFLLQSSVDAVGDSDSGSRAPLLISRLVGLRFFVPALPFLVLAASGGRLGVDSVSGHGGLLPSLLGSVSRTQAAAIVLGLLTYKVPLISRTGSEAVDSLADMPLNTGTTGMVGTIAGLTARAVKANTSPTHESKEVSTDKQVTTGAKNKPPVFIFAGPSGAGKSTLIKMLFAEFPDLFQFSVSHTTRGPREGEIDGVDYNFVDEGKFGSLVEANAFLEYAKVHGNLYGTTVEAVGKVVQSGRSCILDVDVQGVEALAAREDSPWSARFVWVAPPSMEALEERLAGRGSETPESMAARLDTAAREMSFAATSRVFDLTIINEDVSMAYNELVGYVRREMGM